MRLPPPSANPTRRTTPLTCTGRSGSCEDRSASLRPVSGAAAGPAWPGPRAGPTAAAPRPCRTGAGRTGRRPERQIDLQRAGEQEHAEQDVAADHIDMVDGPAVAVHLPRPIGDDRPEVRPAGNAEGEVDVRPAGQRPGGGR